MPISAILFGSRRSALLPLVQEAFGWAHGVYLGATLESETTAAATGATGVVRRDPMAMLPFCGYNMGDYFRHWLNVGKRLSRPPKIFRVNWFRVNSGGKFVWPGFGQNIRVLRWMIDRVHGRAEAVRTPLGFLPTPAALGAEGLSLSKEEWNLLLSVPREEWLEQAKKEEQFLGQFGDRMPSELIEEQRAFLRRLQTS